MSNNLNLARIEQLLKIQPDDEMTLDSRLERIHSRLSEFISHNQSLLHECFLSLSYYVENDFKAEESENESEEESDVYYSNEEDEENLTR